MKTVPLYGKVSAGRVALVDDEDYDLVMQYRWHVKETLREAPRRSDGPYACTMIGRTALYMHDLIMDTKGVDHRDHDGLNNQRSNLRTATEQQNRRNTRNRLGYSSPYKGVYWSKIRRRWHVLITVDSRAQNLGFYASEAEAALAYDDAAREVFGEFAHLNFPDGVPRAVRDQACAEGAAAEAERQAEKRRALSARAAEWWAGRPAETRVCTVCGDEYSTTTPKPSLYCGGACAKRAERQRARERAGQPEPTGPGTLACPVCSRRFMPTKPGMTYCGYRCTRTAHYRRKRQRELEGRLF